MTRIAAFVLLLGSMSMATAQATHVVGPGGLPEITNALAIASPGDVILVQPGTYQPFQATIGITMRALTPGTVTIALGFGPVANIPAGQTAHFVGLSASFFGVAGGSATFDQCSIVGATNGFGGFSASNTSLHLQRCTLRALPISITPPPAPFRVQNCEVTAIDCTIEGADAGLFFGLPGPAIELMGSRLRGSSLTVRGGGGGTFPSAVAISADVGSTVWLSDSALTSPSAPCPVLANNGRLARCTLTPNCGGLPIGNVLGVSRPLSPQNGVPFTLEFRDAPNQLVGVWVALDLQTTSLASLEQALLLAPSGAVAAGVFVTDATGFASGTWPMPSGPTVVDRAVWFQAFTAMSLPWQASAVAGGVVR